ncbi:MAG: sugar transferase [Gemmatimonadaceae bacterium]
MILGKVLGLYDRDDVVLAKRALDDAPALFQVATLVTLLAWLLAGLIFTADLTPTAGLQLWCTCFLALACARTLARALAKAMTDEDRVLLVGSAAAALQIRDKLVDSPGVKATFLGWIPFRGESEQTPALPAAGSIEDLSERVRALAIDRVIVAPTEQTDDEVLDLIRMVKALGVRVSILPRLFEVLGSSVAFDDLGGLTLLGVRPLGLSRSSRVVKRSLDVTGATVGLLATSPLLALAAVAGRDGRSFCIWKFRTMVRDAEDRKAGLLAHNEGAEGFFKITDDPRVTRVGRWLRRTQLDELPQLVNVLKGEMSLVGPRPLLEEEDARVEGWYRRRLQLTPGMTGHWQVLGSSRILLTEMVVLDYLYVANWSLWNDVKILLRTIPRVFGARGL